MSNIPEISEQDLFDDISNKPKQIKQYVLGEVLGKGAYGKVKEAIDSKTLKRVAIKIISKKNLKKLASKAEEQLKNEISIMKELSHKNVVSLIDVFENEEKIFLVVEFCGTGSLEHVLKTEKKLSASDIFIFFKQLIDGLEYLHQQGVIHRDIKPANLMLTPDGILKISDFGVAHKLGKFDVDDTLSTTQGTPTFQCPQIAMGSKNYSGFKTDIWACGVTLYYLVTGTYPFTGDGLYDLYQNIIKCQLEFPDSIDEDLKDLISGMLRKDENERFDIQKIKNHPWYKKKLLEGKKTVSVNLVDRWRSFSLLPYIQKALE